VESPASGQLAAPTPLVYDDAFKPKTINGQLVTCRVAELRPHESYVRHHLTVPAAKLSALAESVDLALIEPLVITQNHIIVDGYARAALARQLRLVTVQCLQYQLSETEALRWLIQKHRRSASLNDFTRILLALDLESGFKTKARANQQAGGQLKRWSNLTKAEVHVRSEVARAAGVSVGNVTKVKQLMEACAPEYIEALHNREVSIHWAWKLRNAAREDQLDALARFRFEKGLMREIRQRASRRRQSESSTPPNASEILSRLNDLSIGDLAAVELTVLKSLRMGIFITEPLARAIGMEQLRLWNQGTSCKNSQQIPDTFGARTRPDSRSATI
jgi:hypothetical protein